MGHIKGMLIWTGASLAAIVVLAIAMGGPGRPKSMNSISAPFKDVDFSGLPALRTFTARDGAMLGYRLYDTHEAPPAGSVVLVHGSSAHSQSLHVLANALRNGGFQTYALDIRGHGASGRRGHIDHVGQLEDDLVDFMQRMHPADPVTLVGFSSGGGFALRFAASKDQGLFANYLLLSPFISQDAATYRPDSGGWVSVGVPRLITLSVLNRLAITALNRLPVTAFALDDADSQGLTAQYDYSLAQNFRPLADFAANIRAIQRPMRVLAGTADEVFLSDRFSEVFRQAGKDVPVELVPGVGHIGMTIEPRALQAIVASVRAMNATDVTTATRQGSGVFNAAK